MQTQPISEAPAPQEQQAHAGPEQVVGGEEHMHIDESPKKKSVMGKVKDKARKLKTKIKKPKSPGSAGNNDESSSGSGSEDENGSEPHEQVGEEAEKGRGAPGERAGEEREVVSTPGLQGEALEAVPDPHVSDAPLGTAGVEQRFGQMSLGDEPETGKLQEEVPSAPGHDVGASPYASEVSRGTPVEEGKNAEGNDLLVTPTSSDIQGTAPMDLEKTPELSKTSDNTAAWYTPTSTEDKPSEEQQQQKPLTDPLSEGTAAAAATGAGILGVKEVSDDRENIKDANVSGEKKSILEQAKERIFGSSKKAESTEQVQTGESKPTITERATGTATGLKDTLAAKLGYGSNKNLTGEGGDSAAVDAQDPANKSVLQKIQESATGATGAVTSKLGYGDKPPRAEGEEVGTGDNKPYTQKAYDAASGAKDAVAAKLGYGSSTSTETPTAEGAPVVEGEQKSYLKKMQETAAGAKDVVASKLGYVNREVPASTEGAYSGEQNVPASTAPRFHPGEEDRALSQLITEKMSTGVTTVKDTLLRPFGASKSGPPTPTTTPPPSSAQAVADDPARNAVTGTDDVGGMGPKAAAGEEKPGIMGKVTGAVSSLLGTSGSGKKRADEATGKASEDPQAAGVCNVETH